MRGVQPLTLTVHVHTCRMEKVKPRNQDRRNIGDSGGRDADDADKGLLMELVWTKHLGAKPDPSRRDAALSTRGVW
jgi:hypothetical protein